MVSPPRASPLLVRRLLRLDALSPATTVGPNARFASEGVVYRQLRERYLLFVGCIEANPGQEPKHPYLYP